MDAQQRSPLDLLGRSRPAPAAALATDEPARLWLARDIERRRAEAFFAFSPSMNRELAVAMQHVRATGLALDTVEQEDLRLPQFARHVDDLRRRLDGGLGAVVLGDIDLGPYSDAETAIVAWAIANYLGRVIRQGLAKDRRIFSVTNQGAANKDAIRIGASSRESAMHTDNGCLEPRPPCSVALACVHAARSGGDSMIAAAATLHDTLLAEHPDLLAVLYQPFHFLPPQLHTWPAGPRTIVKPVFERQDDGIRIHYARVMIEPGMALAGTPLDAGQRAALDTLDAMMQRPDLHYVFRLARGDMLFTNNLQTLHGRAGYEDGADTTARRMLKRIWMWRRHRGPGIDPAALDAAELGTTAHEDSN